MHVVLDATVVHPPFSGVHRAVRHQVAALLRSPQRPAFTVLASDPGLLDAAREAGASALSPPRLFHSRVGRILWQQTLLPRLLRRHRADCLHAMAYTAPVRCPVPVVLNVHDLIPFERPDLCGLRNRWHMRTLMPPALRRADRLVVSASPVADVLGSRFGRDREAILVAPLGVEYDRFAAPAPRPARAPGAPYLLFVGVIEPKKGIDVLLDAWPRVRDETGLSLVVCGRPGWKCRDTVARLRELRKTAGGIWLDDIGDDEIPAWFQHAFATVQPSRIEGFGLPVLESMAAGTPVVHSDHPVLLETAGDCGVPFRNGEPDSLAEAVCELRNEPPEATESRIRTARRHAQSHTWNAWAASVLTTYARHQAP